MTRPRCRTCCAWRGICYPSCRLTHSTLARSSAQPSGHQTERTAGKPGRVPSALDSQLTAAYRGLLEERFGLRLSDQQSEQLNEIVPQLLAMTRYAGPCELIQAFASGWRSDLLRALATSMTVGETHFFRVPAQIRALEQVILPDLIARHA